MLWELSAPDAAHGTPTECLLRIAHTEYYESADKQEPHVLAWMPDVRVAVPRLSHSDAWLMANG